MEGCIKFNPFYVREIREKYGMVRSGEKTTGLMRFESGPDNSKTMSGNPERSSNDAGNALCEVVLDAVWHAQQVGRVPAMADFYPVVDVIKLFFWRKFRKSRFPSLTESTRIGYFNSKKTV